MRHPCRHVARKTIQMFNVFAGTGVFTVEHKPDPAVPVVKITGLFHVWRKMSI